MPLGEIPLTPYGKASSRPSPVHRMMSAFSSGFRDGVDVNLGVGYVDESSIPALQLSGALNEVLRRPDRYRTPFNYGGPEGSPNLIASLKRYLVSRRHSPLTPEVLERNRLLIGPSGVTSILEAIGRLVDPGYVVMSDPLYYIYRDFLERSGFKILAVPEDPEGLDLVALEKTLKSLGKRLHRLRFFYFVTVNNPTGTILSNRRRRELVTIAAAVSRKIRRRVPVFFDQAYEDLVHDPAVDPLESSLAHDPAGIVHELGSLSKILAPALRVGYLVGPDSAFLSALVQKTSDTGFSAPLVGQEIASYMLDHHIQEQSDQALASYRNKARKVRRWIEENLSAFLEEVKGGQAGFYYYLTFRNIPTAEGTPFHRVLSRTSGDPSLDGPPSSPKPRIVYLPGAYCVNPRGPLSGKGARSLRISYAYEPEERLRSAIEMMGTACLHAIQRS